MRTRTPWTYQGKPYMATCGEYIGFLYRIKCNHPEALGKLYIGRKFFWFKFNTKTLRKESDWKTYKGSSKNVHAAIEQYGEEHFEFEIIQLFRTKGGLTFAELEALYAAEVLHATNEAGERLYWNDCIGNVKFIAKERFSPEHKARLAAAWTDARKQSYQEPAAKEIRAKAIAACNTPLALSRKKEAVAVASKKPERLAHLRQMQANRVAAQRKVTPELAAQIKKLVAEGNTRAQISQKLGISVQTISRVNANKLSYLNP